jgi:hypothetical protein
MVPEFTMDEIIATPDSVFEKISRFFAESIGFGKKAKLAERTWNGP